MKRFTEKTIINKELLKTEINKVKKQGFALDLGKHEKDVCCVATSILNYQGKIIGVICLSLPYYRSNPKKLDIIKEAIMQTGREISKQMGHNF